MRAIEGFIGGKSVKATSGRTGDVFNPNIGEVQAKVGLATVADVDAAVQAAAKAFPGWSGTTFGVTDWDALPLNARRYLERVKEFIGAPIDMVSTGPDRVHTILLRHPFRA